MNLPASFRPRVLPSGAAGAAVATLLLFACRDKPVDLPELFATRAAGVTFLQRGQLPEAEAQFQKLIELAPKDPLGYANLGLTYLRAGRYDDAGKPLRRARELDPKSVEVGLIVARLYSLTGRWDDARAVLEGLSKSEPANAKVLYALSELTARDSSAAGTQRHEQAVRRVLAAAPANLAVQLKLVDVFMKRCQADSAARRLEELRRLRPEPPAEAEAPLRRTIELLRVNQLAQAREAYERFSHMIELWQPYQAALADVQWLDGPIVGRPVLSFKPQSRITLPGAAAAANAESMRFTDVTADAHFTDAAPGAADAPGGAHPTVLAAADFHGSGMDDLLVSLWSAERHALVTRVYRVRAGEVADVTDAMGLSLTGVVDAAVGDVDNDGWLDVLATLSDGNVRLLRNTGAGRFEDATARAGIGSTRSASKGLFLDADHDGDMDALVLGGALPLLYRNNTDGTFTDVAAAAGLGGAGVTRDAAFADLDGDGRVDLLLATATGPRLFHNDATRGFVDVTAASGLPSAGELARVAIADYDNDARLDVLLLPRGAAPTLWRNDGDAVFANDTRSTAALRPIASLDGAVMRFMDADNDGWLDLLVAATPRTTTGRTPGVLLLHNAGDGRFSNRPDVVPRTMGAGARAVAPVDMDDDGDLDLFVSDGAAVHVLRNDGGNANLAVDVTLIGLRAGSGKNNDFGVGARIELRAGELLQTRVVTDRVTHFGLGPHLKADVLRIEWPNGVPQTVYFPGTDKDVLELEQLKGSCAFLYTWDGTRFRFITDVLWRSALGMPVGIMGDQAAGRSRVAYAPAQASQEYVRIPGDALRPRDGQYVLQLTEELWETAYMDAVRLVAVDHPDSVDVLVDERFVPPGPPSATAPRLRTFGARRPPLAAVDERGRDVLPRLLAADHEYVGSFTLTRYQGLVAPHALEMNLGPTAGTPGTSLVLRGWIYPTDASINVALAQQTALVPSVPSLEVRDAHGIWTTAVASIGFPAGKDKTLIVELTGLFPTADHHVRIRTNMQIYWDQAYVAHDASQVPMRTTSMQPIATDLHFRGYSRMFRAGGPDGPHWFDYDSVTTTAPWRTIEGAFTRYGSVVPLLREAEDEYVIMAPGDEMTVQFDASHAPTLPAGWTRDFLIYTDGWIKDSDLNTAFGTSVAPLPFHAIRSYPYGAGEAYPRDADHDRYQRDYNTRIMSRR